MTNSTSTMPPRSCLTSNSSERLGCPALILSRMPSTSPRSACTSRGMTRMSARMRSKRAPASVSPAA
ncbi:Uncharacterised protein [Bordetella pertussis]|nr:Uncharacterised protein [Bordetella pertussis]